MWKKTVYGKVNEVSISEDGEYITAATDGDRFYVYDKSGDLVWNYANKDFNLGEISADGKYAVGAEYTSGQKRIYYFSIGECSDCTNHYLWYYQLPDGSDSISDVSISGNGDYVVATVLGSGSTDNKVLLFGRDSNALLWTYNVSSYTTSVAISTDGNYIVAGSDNNSNSEFILFERDSSTKVDIHL